MRLHIDLATKLVPLPDDQRAGWELAMQEMAELTLDLIRSAQEEEVAIGEAVETSYEATRPV